MRLFPSRAAALLAAAVPALPPPVSGQAVEWWPGTTYDAAIPTPASVLGHEIGAYWTEHAAMTDYMRRLEAVSDRVKVFSVGRSHERREILLVAISDPANMRRLEEIRQAVARLRDPRQTSEAQAREIARDTPAPAWMSFANDGNESAALETAIQLAYHLAAGTDETTRRVLREVVTLVYPSHNPESHSRHVAWMKASATGNPDPAAQEHRGDWRMDTNNNHYQIDLNRDAAFLSQGESRVAVREIHRWNPVVYVDHHGNPDRFFFPPWARPVNPQVDAASRRWVEVYGRAIAAAFDRGGWTYFTRQVFDLHYPGYFDSYPALNGATGMTFETDGGGSKGLAYRLPDGRVTTLRDGVLHHFTGAMASLLTTAENREARLRDLHAFRAGAMAEVAQEKVKQFVLVPGKDPARAADLVDLLLAHHVEVRRATAPFSSAAAHDLLTDAASRRSFPAGALLIAAAQPQKRLLRTLLDRETPLEEEFLAEVRKAKAYNDGVGEAAPKKPYGFYDVNAWSLPLAYGVEAYWTEDEAAPPAQEVTARPAPTAAAPSRARYAYLFPWNSRGATRVVAALWQEKYQVALAREAFTIEGRTFDKATVVVRALTNPPSLHERLIALARENEVELLAADGALVESGRDLGDRSVLDLKPARLAVVSEPPTSATAFGAVWFLLEQTYGIPFTAIKGQDLAGADLREYDVLLLPDGPAAAWGRLLDGEVLERLRGWVREGGTLVCIKGAAAWAAGDKVKLTTARDRYAAPAEEGRPAGKDDKGQAKEPPRRIDTVPGVFVKVNVDADHYLGAGVEGPLVALLRSNVVFEPSKKGAQAALLDKGLPIVAGFAFDEAKEPLKGAPFLWEEPLGRGRVVLFAEDVAFRTFLHAAHRLLLNALLLAPSQSGRGGG
jgi:hypothetical protein